MGEFISVRILYNATYTTDLVAEKSERMLRSGAEIV
jgi:hypothetical protein